ncbi:Hypothetical_protein [Hexamita inflata]|uniref:Hypothetical_protein n=1 Tax=Hexamita inflata TaxID=28002 RepID=A0AA86R863_9EUKA|nr:Hypothetical protein HINF_LOCUS51070 [Hexamita inflata]
MNQLPSYPKIGELIPPHKSKTQKATILPPIQKRVSNLSNLSTVNSSSSNFSQSQVSKSSFDTFRVITSNANVNKVLVNMQDRPQQIEHSVQLGNSWSNSNLSNISDDDLLLDNFCKLRVVPLISNNSMRFDKESDSD